VGLVGVALASYGVLRLVALGPANLRATFEWLVAGVLLHDAVFSPLVLAVSGLAAAVLPRRLLAPAAVVLVIVVSATLVAVPELGRLGVDPHNPTLQNRHYWLGWSALVTLVVVAVATPALIGGGDRGAGDGGR
jgi:hypothetical protein